MTGTEPPSTAHATLALASAPPAFRAYAAEVVPLIDATLERLLAIGGDDPGRLMQAMRYATLDGGKRFRPLLLCASCEAVGGDRGQALLAAAGLEMLHAYTLIHDDLPCMDDDDERRGRPTVHIAFGEAIAVLAGDALLTAAFGAVAQSPVAAGPACAVLARRAGAAELLGGQARDIADRAPETIDELETIHRGKTGALFAAATEIGALVGGAPTETATRMGEFGIALGLAFQFADDRDDGEHLALAAAGAQRTRDALARTRAVVQECGAQAALLDGIATWFAERLG